jgi:hypothetical protein
LGADLAFAFRHANPLVLSEELERLHFVVGRRPAVSSAPPRIRIAPWEQQDHGRSRNCGVPQPAAEPRPSRCRPYPPMRGTRVGRPCAPCHGHMRWRGRGTQGAQVACARSAERHGFPEGSVTGHSG